MKLHRIAAAVMTSALLLGGCVQDTAHEDGGQISDGEISQTSEKTSLASDELSLTSEKTSQTSGKDSQPSEGNSDSFQSVEIDIAVEEKPEITKAVLSGECSRNIKGDCYFSEEYPGNVFVSSWVGLIGAPIVLSGSENIENGSITLYYDDTKLRGVPEKNICAIYTDEKLDSVERISDIERDEEKNTVRVPLCGDGYYILYDIYQYGMAMGEDVEAYAYEKDITAYETDWEMKCDTGDIMTIADKKWAFENAPEFNVENPVQLASAVYYANSLTNSAAEKRSEVIIHLKNDLDLHKFKWAPIGWSNGGAYLDVVIDGGGHTIHFMNIDMPSGNCVGIIGYAKSITMTDISFDAAHVVGRNHVGILCGECHGKMLYDNVSVSGMVSGSEKSSGSFVGAGGNGVYTNCVNNVFVNNEKSEYYCHNDEHKAKNSNEGLYSLTVDENGDVTRTKSDNSEYSSLGWVILEKDGTHVLTRNAENETKLSKSFIQTLTDKDYTVHLEAFYNGGYVKVSNTVEIKNS